MQLLALASKVPSDVSSSAFAATIWAGIALIIMLIAILTTRDAAEKSDTRLILLGAMAGAGLGWAVGILVSPVNSAEQALFGKYEALVGGFISGFLSSKLTTLFTDLQTKGAFTNRASLSKMLAFAASFLIITAAVFNVRQYAGTGVRVTADANNTDLAPEKSVQLFANVRDPIDTSVVWSLDPTTIGECSSVAIPAAQGGTTVPSAGNCPTISEAGLFTAPKTRTEPGIIGVLATNRHDRTKVGRIELTIVSGKEASKPANASVPEAKK